MFHSMRVRKIVRLRNALLEDEYQRIRRTAHIKSSHLAIENLNSLEDRKEYLAKDNSEC